MEIRKYWTILRRWIWLVVLGALLAGTVTYLVSRRMTPVYQTYATLLVTPGSAQSTDSYTNLIASERLARTYAQLLTSSPIMEATYDRLNEFQATEEPAGAQSQSLGFSAAASSVELTQLIRLQVTGTDPELIALAANTLIEEFIKWQTQVQQSRYAESKVNLEAEMERVQATIQGISEEVEALLAEGQTADQDKINRLQDQLTQYRNSYSQLLNNLSVLSLAEANAGDTMTVVSPATVPGGPISPRVMRNTLLAAAAGALLAAGAST